MSAKHDHRRSYSALLARIVVGITFVLVLCFQFHLILHTSTKAFRDSMGVADLSHQPPVQKQKTQNRTTTEQSQFAYAFIIGGCHPDRPAYRNYIYDVLVSTRILRDKGSKADVVAFFQMSYESEEEELPEDDKRLLIAMNIRIKYIPKSHDESFYSIMHDKFRILDLTEYKRVLFMDADVMPINNLDYLFELSVGVDPLIKENLIVSGALEPANGGFFMLSPKKGALAEITAIIRDREERGKKLPYPYFDEAVGWGHVIQSPDKWQTNNPENWGTNWTFLAAFCDQGLLYHWTKYAQKSVTIVFADYVQNWGTLPNGTVALEKTLIDPFQIYSNGTERFRYTCKKFSPGRNCPSPYRDFVHFTGKKKPWLKGPPKGLAKEKLGFVADHLWFETLRQLNEDLKMGLDGKLHKWTSEDRPLLGMYPTVQQAINGYLLRDTSLEDRTIGDSVASQRQGDMQAVRTGPFDEGQNLSRKDDRLGESSHAKATDELATASSNSANNQTNLDRGRYRFAYAFVVGGCDPINPVYRGYLYDILVSTRILRDNGSKADVVAFFQMSYKSRAAVLPDDDIRLLEAMNVHIKYIPKTKDESFYSIMLDKFRILTMTEYDRVLFMDGDVLPVNNLDYLFELSVGRNPLIKKNLVVAGAQEPSNGGLFMLAPSVRAIDAINDIIRDREERGKTLPYPHFDETVGWGHVIQPPDKWETNKPGNNGTKYTFLAAFADQGLLYHWTKYVQKSVSIVFATEVQNWEAVPNGTVVLKERLVDPFKNFSNSKFRFLEKCSKFTRGRGCPSPYQDFVHFTGRSKPWLKGPPSNLAYATRADSAEHLWFYTLKQLDKDLKMGLKNQLRHWTNFRTPLLGLHPDSRHAISSKTNIGGQNMVEAISGGKEPENNHILELCDSQETENDLLSQACKKLRSYKDVSSISGSITWETGPEPGEILQPVAPDSKFRELCESNTAGNKDHSLFTACKDILDGKAIPRPITEHRGESKPLPVNIRVRQKVRNQSPGG